MNRDRVVELVASEPGAVGRSNFPLTVGVPFRPGFLPSGEPVSILDGTGKPGAVQTRVMETHGDGSAKWLLVDYQADMPPLGASSHALVAGEDRSRPAKGRRIEIRERGSGLLVDNGVLELRMDRDRCKPLECITCGGRAVTSGGLDFRVTSEEGQDFYARNDPEARFEVEESGPLRLLLRWEGSHVGEGGARHLDVIVRLTVYGGNPFLRVDHTLINRLDPAITRVKEAVAEFPIRLPGTLHYTAADIYRPPTDFAAESPVSLEQHRLGHFRIIDSSGEVLREFDDNSMGWLDVSGSRRGLLLAGKNFWQNHPKEISTDGRSLRCHLVPDTGRPFPFPRGMAKTHTFFLYLHEGRTNAQRLIDLAFTVQRWPMPRAPSGYYQECGQLWDYFPSYPGLYPRLEAGLRNLFEPDRYHFPRNPSIGRAYGLKHYGDFVTRAGPDPDSPETYYLNNEYDTPHVLAMMFLRTGEVAKWWGAEAHALHMMDVDTCHHAVAMEHQPDPKLMLNSQYRHCYQHIGSIQSPGDPRHIPASGSHTFAEGLLDYYHLTGDRRALEIASGYARNLAYAFGLEEPVGAGRYSGWALLVMGGVQMVQPDEAIRREAERTIDKIISQQEEGGGILEATMHPRAFEDRRVHLCVRGLVKWHQATGDGKTRKLILDLMEAYLKSGLTEEGLPLYSNWPEDSKATTAMQGFANLESLSYAYSLTGDVRYVEAGIPGLCQAVQWIIDPDEEARSNFQRILRGPFPFMAIAHKLGLLAQVPGAGQWLDPEPGSDRFLS
jgi:hypothetical protein